MPPKHSTPETNGVRILRKRDAPFGEILDHLRQVIELAPAGQHEHVADHQPHHQRPGPGEIRRDPRRQNDEKIDDEIHESPPGSIVEIQHGMAREFRPEAVELLRGSAEILQRRKRLQQPDADA